VGINQRANDLRTRESAIFNLLERETTFTGKLYRDGIPTPRVYLAQRVRVLFVFREPNMGGVPYAHDMRDEVSDVRFRRLGPDGVRMDVSPKSWWNAKAGMFAHAVAAALDAEHCRQINDKPFLLPVDPSLDQHGVWSDRAAPDRVETAAQEVIRRECLVVHRLFNRRCVSGTARPRVSAMALSGVTLLAGVERGLRLAPQSSDEETC